MPQTTGTLALTAAAAAAWLQTTGTFASALSLRMTPAQADQYAVQCNCHTLTRSYPKTAQHAPLPAHNLSLKLCLSLLLLVLLPHACRPPARLPAYSPYA
jgi:hypothetical protein